MSDALLWGPSVKRLPKYFEIEGDDERPMVSIPSRKIPFVAPPDYRPDTIEIAFLDVINAKADRRRRAGPKLDSVSSSGEDKRLKLNKIVQLFRNWDVWDYVVGIGLIILFIGMLIPLISDKRALAFLAPLGAILMGVGAIRARKIALAR